MPKKLSEFVQYAIHDFIEALINIFIFLPYFFSVSTLLKTLFTPWKSLVTKREKRGFDLADWFNQITFNLVSRGIGFGMRLSIILFYLLIQILLVIVVPIFFIVYVIFLPVLFFIKLNAPSEEEKKNELKNQFVSRHLLKQENYQHVEQWFEYWYQGHALEQKWWKLSNLFSVPPLARDWAVGYTPILDDYADDLTHTAYQKQRNHLIGRKKEITQIEQVLSKSGEANIIIVGDEGVGKHAIIDLLAKKMYEGKSNSHLAYKRLLQLNMEKILTKFTDMQQRQAFLEELFLEAQTSKSAILLIENFHKYISQNNSGIDLTSSIVKFARSAEIQFIGVTTSHNFETFVYPNEQINRLFTKIDVGEVSKDEALTILLDSAIMSEARYKVSVPYETLLTIIEKSSYFITDIPFPEKAIQLLDNACVYAINTAKKNNITPEMIDVVITQKTHVPTTLSDQLKDTLLHLESLLSQKIFDQREAILELSAALRRAFLLLGKRKKPLASFLFLGPTGVGKTETAKAIAECFFNSATQLIRFDMSAYQTDQSIEDLIGSSENNTPGQLTSAVREHPYGVLLLDEIEKADKEILNIFLTILDEGYFVDVTGKRVDCKNLIIIATSNAGADLIFQTISQSGTLTTNDLISYLIQKGMFSPEFLNRFDGIVSYKPLQITNITDLAKNMVTVIISEIFQLYKVKLSVSDETIRNVAEKEYNPAFGARNLERALRNELEDRVAKMILSGEAKEGDSINL